MRYALILAFLALATLTFAFAQDPDPAPALEEAAPEAPEEETPAVDAEPEKKEVVPEVDVPENEDEAVEDVQGAISALQTGQWATFAVLLLGLIVFGYNKWTAAKAAKAADPVDTSK